MIQPISFPAVLYLAVNMRAADAREIYATLDHSSPDKLAREVCLATAFGKAGISWQAGKPVGIVGVSPIRSGVWAIWSFGTDDWASGVIDMTRFGYRQLRPFLLGRGAHRLQCESHIDHTEAHRWLALCGARREGVLRGYGRDGSDFIQFSWTKDDANVFFPAQGQHSGPQAGAGSAQQGTPGRHC